MSKPTVERVQELLEDLFAEEDYDLYKANACDEETGENHFPAMAEHFHAALFGEVY